MVLIYRRRSSVTKMTTVHYIIILATGKYWPLFQLNINNAFLHDDLHEEVFI